MKVIVINSETRSIELKEISSIGLQPIYDEIGNGCDTFECPITLPNRDTFFVDEEGRLKKQKGAFQIIGYHSPLVGNAVIIGSDKKGNGCDVKSTVGQIFGLIEFLHVL